MHWPCIRGLVASAGVRLRAMKLRSVPPHGLSFWKDRPCCWQSGTFSLRIDLKELGGDKMSKCLKFCPGIEI